MSREQEELLDVMRRDNQAAPPPYRATEIWSRLGAMFEDWLYLEGIRGVEDQTMNRYFASPAPRDPKLLRYACWLLYRDLKSRDKRKLLDRIGATVGVESGYAFEFEGRRVSWDLLISLDSLYTMAEATPAVLSEPVVVADIGAGWGRMGYVLKMANPRATYVVLDLPEVLLVASAYLPRLLSHERVMPYAESRTRTRLSRQTLQEYGCVFLGAQGLECIEDKALDIVMNIASFQEMARPQLVSYFETIQRKCGGALYLLQLRHASTHGFGLGEVEGLADYPFPESWKCRVLRSPAWSDLYFESLHEMHSPTPGDASR